MSNTVIKVENLSKQYRLGQVSTGALSHDLNRLWYRIRGKEDPYLKIGEANDRTTTGSSDYVWALRDINFEVKHGEVLGIIGRNGAGKSTLLKILSRTTAPTTGSIKIKGRVASLLEVGTGFHPELSGRDNIFLNGAILGMTKKEIARKFDEIVDFAGVERYIDTPVKRYSSGMYVRLAFAVAAHLEPEILIVDEVLAVGDSEFQKKCLGKMKDVSERDGRTVLFVSHNMAAVKQLCTHCLYLKNGNLYTKGETNEVIQQYLKETEYKQTSNFVYDGRVPKITGVSLDENALQKGTLKISIQYCSPFKIRSVNPGIVIYNALHVPVFGSNTRFHSKSENITENTNGTIEFIVNSFALHSGTYTISVWLGDEFSDYDYIDNGLTFEYESNKSYASIPDPLDIGSVDMDCNWIINN